MLFLPNNFGNYPKVAVRFRRGLLDKKVQVSGRFPSTLFRECVLDHDEPGIYVNIVSGEPLFSSPRQVRQQLPVGRASTRGGRGQRSDGVSSGKRRWKQLPLLDLFHDRRAAAGCRRHNGRRQRFKNCGPERL
jgi:hypothetical protein